MNIPAIINYFSTHLQSVNFFSEYYSKKTLHISNALQNTSSVIDNRDVECFIRFSPKNPERVKMLFAGNVINENSYVKNGIVDFDAITKLHLSGATLVVNGLNDYSNRLYYLAKYLEKLFECKVHCNFYGTA